MILINKKNSDIMVVLAYHYFNKSMSQGTMILINKIAMKQEGIITKKVF
jgi:hypothetical protein